MFYDERIEAERGRCSRGAIVIAVVIALLNGSIRAINILRNAPGRQYLLLVAMEAVVVVSGLVCLAVGALHGRSAAQDERLRAEQCAFYSRAAGVMAGIVAVAYAVLLPISLCLELPGNFTGGYFDITLWALLFTIGIFVACELKHRDIYFNYSLMETEHYYRGVLANIGRMAGGAAVLFAISAVLSLVLLLPAPEALAGTLLRLLLIYLVVAAAFITMYLLLSFLERESYRVERGISRTTIILSVIAIAIYAAYTAIVFWANIEATRSLSQAYALQLILLVSAPLKTYIRLALLLFLIYFAYEYRQSRGNRAVTAGCLTILAAEVLYVICEQLLNSVLQIFMPELLSGGAYAINEALSLATTAAREMTAMADAAGVMLIIAALCRDRALHRGHLAALPVLALMLGSELFLLTQLGTLALTACRSLGEVAVLAYLVWVTCRVYRGLKQ